jgi:uncharacterized protein (UPF0332 family)
LGQHYIKENKIEKQFNLLYEKLFNLRQTSDYEDWIYVNEEDLNPLLEPAQEFIKTIESLINSSNLAKA